MIQLLHDDPAYDDADFTGPRLVGFGEVNEADLDQTPDEEGDDKVHTNKLNTSYVYRPQELTSKPLAPAPVRIVEHHRDIKFRSAGKDVVALKRALAHMGYFPKRKKRTSYFGGTLRKSLRKFQSSHGLKADGVYGANTHKKLVRAGGFDRYGAYLMAHAPLPESREARQRRLIVAYWTWAYHNRDRIYYLQRRPMHINSIYEIPSYEDCSEFVTRGYKAAGATDPNRLGYSGSGYTGTMANAGMRVNVPRPADFNLYGSRWSGYSHTTGQASTTAQGDLCFSMGNSAGPLLLRRKYRTDFAETRSTL